MLYDDLLLRVQKFEMRALQSNYCFLKSAQDVLSDKPSSTVDDSIISTKKLSGFLGIPLQDDVVARWQQLNASYLDIVRNEDLHSTYDSKKLICWKTTGKKHYAIEVYKTRQSGLEESKSYFLKGISPIPDLYMYVLNLGSHETEGLSGIDVDLAHYAFLVSALKKLCRLDLKDKEDVDSIKDFISENKNKIDRIKRFFTSVPQMLGSGAEAIVFSIGSGRVIKFFMDNYTYNILLQNMKILHEKPELSKTEIMVYDVGFIGDFGGGLDIYYAILPQFTTVVQEDLPDVTGKIRQIIYKILQYVQSKPIIKRLETYFLRSKNYERINKIVETLAKDCASKIKSSHAELIDQIERLVQSIKGGPYLSENWLETLAEEFITKYVTHRRDLHAGNIGITEQGEFRFFDPAHHMYTEEHNITEVLTDKEAREIFNKNYVAGKSFDELAKEYNTTRESIEEALIRERMNIAQKSKQFTIPELAKEYNISEMRIKSIIADVEG
jgi:hypothetical protein